MSLISELQSKNKHLSDLLENQDKEVESLRDLLKECKDNYKKYLDFAKENGCRRAVDEFGEILTRINAAIGESEE